MLGKLIKYDMKSISKVMGLLCIILAGYSLLIAVMLQTPIYANMFSGKNSGGMVAFGGVTGIFGFIALIIMIGSINVAGAIYLGVRFFKSMYDDEGYLTHTLPATPKQILTSKFITGTLWMLIIRLVIGLSLGLIMLSILIVAVRNGVDLADVYDKAIDIIENDMMFYQEYFDAFVKITVHALTYGTAYTLFNPFVIVAHVFGALTIGQCFKKNRGFLGVVMYFAISWGTSFVMMIVRGIFQMFSITRLMSGNDSEMLSYMNKNFFVNYDLQLIVTIIISIVLVYISHRIIVKRLNLI